MGVLFGGECWAEGLHCMFCLVGLSATLFLLGDLCFAGVLGTVDAKDSGAGSAVRVSGSRAGWATHEGFGSKCSGAVRHGCKLPACIWLAGNILLDQDRFGSSGIGQLRLTLDAEAPWPTLLLSSSCSSTRWS